MQEMFLLPLCTARSITKQDMTDYEYSYRPGYITFDDGDTITDKARWTLTYLLKSGFCHPESVDFIAEHRQLIQNSQYGIVILRKASLLSVSN